MTDPLHVQIAAEMARLEQLRRRKGIVTVRLVSEALPPYLRSVCTTYDMDAIAKAINAGLDAEQVEAPAADHQTRAAGDA